MQDHPVIQNMERTGWADGKEQPYPICPVCGDECQTIYQSRASGQPLGCDNCIEEEDAWEWDERQTQAGRI